MAVPKKHIGRQQEITDLFLEIMNRHMDDFMAGKVDELLHLQDFAAKMFLHPIHVSNVIKAHTGHHPCYYYEMRILEEAKKLLQDENLSINDVAIRLTYDKSNFTKWFKKFQGVTPTEFRKEFGFID